MRLLALDLERYGPFTDKRLVFRADARLHVVHGPNEAGKSCSLAALTDLLFGIERNTRFDWLHPGKDMRLGAMLRTRDGEEFRFRRRKNKPVLSDRMDAALPESALAPFLGGLTRDVFRRAFGLDAEGLRKSAEDLRHTDGELGAALFSAASGLRGISDVKAALDAEADGIFGERKAKDRTFYQALSRYEDARKLLRESETRAGDLKTLREQVATHERRRKEIRERRSAIAAEQARLARLRRATPILKLIDADEVGLAALSDVPAAASGTGTHLLEALKAQAAAQKSHDDAAAQVQSAIAALDGMTVDHALLDRADDIEHLRTELGEYRKGSKDLPGVDRDLETAARDLAVLAARLGIAPTEIVTRQPDDASRALVEELAARGRELVTKLETRVAERDAHRAELARRRHERGSSAGLCDPRPLRERLSVLAGSVRIAEQVAEQAPALDLESATLARDAARLDPPVRNLPSLAQIGMPGSEAIALSVKHFAELDTELRDSRLARDSALHECASLTTALHELAAGGTVPTPDVITALRAERDAHWTILAQTLFGAPDAPKGHALHESIAAFERTKVEADRLADAAAGDAQRVASHADTSRRLARATVASLTLKATVESLEARRATLLTEWRARWEASGIDPLEPGLMAGWRLQLDGLMSRLALLDERKLGLKRIQEDVTTAWPAFNDLLADLGLVSSQGLTLPVIAQRIDAEIERLAKAWGDARDQDTLLSDLERRVGEADAAVVTASEALDDWRDAFRAALPRVGLSGEATPAEAEAALAAWRDAPKTKATHDGLARRVAGLRRDGAQFETAVSELAGHIAPDLVGQDPESVLHTLHQRLTAAREARARRGDAVDRLAEAQRAAEEAKEGMARVREQLDALAHSLGVVEGNELAPLAARLFERDALEASLTTRREELARTTEGVVEVALRSDLAGWDPDETAARAAELQEEDEDLDAVADETFGQLQQARAKLDALQAAVGAEVAHQQRRNAEAEMAEAAREWAVLKIAATMLGTSLARQRLGRQEPLMRRAGELFAILTGGSFEGLGQTYDDNDIPHLVGRRPDGRECAVHELSEGARDQLYLALRLAYVDDYASRAEPPPFIGDDLFASFDDVRTANGLRALAAIGEKVQPILFTHHRYVVDAAVRELGKAVDVIELG